MWAIGVKTAATCDTIDGLSVKESAPPSRREATRFPPGPSPASSESRPDVGVGRTGPGEELEARRVLRDTQTRARAPVFEYVLATAYAEARIVGYVGLRLNPAHRAAFPCPGLVGKPLTLGVGPVQPHPGESLAFRVLQNSRPDVYNR